mmetsp:Transcript_48984/g.106507  ORF Transcript_48984/g.106507 Transcript_48984/m.106507 type:complete len:210 (+) Transcript_48984:40-669(+)
MWICLVGRLRHFVEDAWKRAPRHRVPRPFSFNGCGSWKTSTPKRKRHSAMFSASGDRRRSESLNNSSRPSTASLRAAVSAARAASKEVRSRDPLCLRKPRACAARSLLFRTRLLSLYPRSLNCMRSSSLEREKPSTKLPEFGVLISSSLMLWNILVCTCSGIFSPSLIPRLFWRKSFSTIRFFRRGLCWSVLSMMTLKANVYAASGCLR